MTFEELLRVLKRWGWLVLIPTTLGFFGAVLDRPPAPAYQTSIRLAVGIRPEGRGDYDYEGYYRWLSSEYLAAAVSAWVRSWDFAERVAAQLQAEGLTLSPPAVQGALASDYQRSLVVLYVTASDPGVTEAIARAAVAVARREVDQVWPQSGEGMAVLTPLDVTAASPTAPPLRARLGPLFRIALGLLGGFTMAFLADFLDPRIWDRTDVKRLGFRVLGEIPRRRGNE